MSKNWTTNDMPDLTGKVIIVTGANSGIGFEAAKAFSRKGAQTILACRNMDKAKSAMAQIKEEIPDAAVDIMQLDLASLASVQQFADTFKANYERLDVLVNNGGIMWRPYATTEDGFESHFATNHLGHFALTGHLLDILLGTPNARIVTVSSTAHRHANLEFDNLLFEGGEGYNPHQAYSRSKLANLLFTYELQRRLEEADSSVIAVAAHPGSSNTNLVMHVFDVWYRKILYPLMLLVTQSAAMGALPSLRAAVDPHVKGGQYYGPGGLLEQWGHPVVIESNRASHNEADARRLWEASEALTGVRYNFNKIPETA